MSKSTQSTLVSSLDEFGPETKASSSAELIAQYGNTSNAIRALLSQGYTRVEVKNILHIKYQHVRNVEITPIKRPAVIK